MQEFTLRLGFTLGGVVIDATIVLEVLAVVACVLALAYLIRRRQRASVQMHEVGRAVGAVQRSKDANRLTPGAGES